MGWLEKGRGKKKRLKGTGNYLKILVQFQHHSLLFVWQITDSSGNVEEVTQSPLFSRQASTTFTELPTMVIPAR